MARKYTKRSEYWSKFEKKPNVSSLTSLTSEDFEPQLIGDSLLNSANASRLDGSSSRTGTRKNRVSTGPTRDRFANIADGLLPYEYSADYVGASEAVVLSQKAYFNISSYKATIDLMSEFADSDIYLEGGTQKSRSFFNAWFRKIVIERVKEQYFREYYRSGNVFFNRMDAALTESGVSSTIRDYGVSNASRGKLPVKYLLLNPAEIAARGALQFDDNQYFKILTPFELAALRKRNTDEEKELYNSLPQDLQKSIDSEGSHTNQQVYLPLDVEKIHPIFYKKQDYEPLAIPMGFCVLDDINKKMELKKVDQAIARSIENVVLLVTMGAEPDKGGINHKNISAMQTIFQNKSVGRVLVADYTTKADFVIPDMKKVLGKEKYEVLNADIHEGLQNIMLGDSKYADAQMKLRVFFQRLDEARDVFLRDFLQPEIKRIAKEFGLRNPPEAKFTRLDTLDNAALQKLVIRMMELNILTPEQGLDVINTGVFPDSKSLDKAQEKFKEQRDKEHFIPLANNVNLLQIESQQEMQKESLKSSEKIAKQNKIASPVGGTPKPQSTAKPNTGRPVGTSEINRGPRESKAFAIDKITDTVKLFEDFAKSAATIYRKEKGIKRLNKKQKETINDLCEKVVTAHEADDWKDALLSICKDPTKLLDIKLHEGVGGIADEHTLDEYSAAILYHSTKLD